jgi:hypothetical protein
VFQFAAHKTYHPSAGVIFSRRNDRQTNRCALRTSNQSDCLCELPTLHVDSRLFGLSDGQDPDNSSSEQHAQAIRT